REGLSRRVPDLIFLDVSQASSETVESVKALAERSYRGPVQLMSDGAESVMAEQIGQLGQRSALRLLPALAKPIDRAAIRKVVRENQLDGSATVSGQISLDEALGNNWLEFWYQPKIDLRKKQLAGVETFARVRHPQHGIMLPGAFMENATEQS